MLWRTGGNNDASQLDLQHPPKGNQTVQKVARQFCSVRIADTVHFKTQQMTSTRQEKKLNHKCNLHFLFYGYFKMIRVNGVCFLKVINRGKGTKNWMRKATRLVQGTSRSKKKCLSLRIETEFFKGWTTIPRYWNSLTCAGWFIKKKTDDVGRLRLA